MHELPSLNPVERELESRLGGLSPTRHRINRDALMFRAGQAAGQRATRRWRAATVTSLTMLMLGLVATLPWQARQNGGVSANLGAEPSTIPASTPADRSPARPRTPVAVLAMAPSAAAEYLRLREAVLVQGVDALPSIRWAPLPEPISLEAGSWRRQRDANHNRIDLNLLWQRNLNDESKRS
jgi:hypothetical protein